MIFADIEVGENENFPNFECIKGISDFLMKQLTFLLCFQGHLIKWRISHIKKRGFHDDFLSEKNNRKKVRCCSWKNTKKAATRMFDCFYTKNEVFH